MVEPVALAGELQEEYAWQRQDLRVDAPWFATYDAAVRGRTVRYHLGELRHGDYRIVDWRSPIAKPYYTIDPGADYEIDATENTVLVEGRLDRKAAVFADHERLTRVIVVDGDGHHTVVAAATGFELAGPLRPPSTLQGLPGLAALLTPEQYRLIAQTRTRPVIIQGRAGSGKTSVALHRVAWLTYASDDPSAPPPIARDRVLVVMFNKALSKFVSASLRDLGMEGVVVDTFHGWALGRVRDAYNGKLDPASGGNIPGHDVSVAIKKRLGTLQALDAFVAQQERALLQSLAGRLQPLGEAALVDRFKMQSGPVVARLRTAQSAAKTALNGARGRETERWTLIHEVVAQALNRIRKYKEDLYKFLRDSTQLAEHLPDVSVSDLATLASYQQALQGREGTDRRPGPYVAWEDLALLLHLIQRKNGGFPAKDNEERVALYDHVVIDEAQDFGAVDLRVMIGAARHRRSVTIVGDVNQKIVPTADFMGWNALAAELGVDGSAVAHLEVAHRSTQPIMDVADAIIGGDPTVGARAGRRPQYFHETSDEAVFQRILLLIDDLVERDEAAHVCVVCAHRDEAAAPADRLKTVLEGVTEVRLGHNDQFVFGRGVTVTNYRQVKGLEFDAVIVVGPSEANYPTTDAGRSALYTTCTRARDRLDLVGRDNYSALLDRAVESGALEIVGTPSFAPLTFSEEELDEAF